MRIRLDNKQNVNKKLFWIKGLKVDEKSRNMIFVWNQEVTCFNTLDSGTCVGRYHKLTSKEDYITDLIISEEFKYFITSTIFGQIYVWKLNVRTTFISSDLNQDGKSLKTKRKLIHSFTGHTKKVTSLANHPNNSLFISASLD